MVCLTSHAKTAYSDFFRADSASKAENVRVNPDPAKGLRKSHYDSALGLCVCAGAQVVTEYENNAEKQSYVYHSYVDDPIAIIKANGDTNYYHSNHLFSTEVITDNNGNLVETYDYDSHGKVTVKDSLGVVQTASAIGNAYGFTGRRLDAESGLYYMRARSFDPQLGVFISRDPLGYIDGWSMYRGYFVPRGLDPLGLFTLKDALNELVKGLPEEQKDAEKQMLLYGDPRDRRNLSKDGLKKIYDKWYEMELARGDWWRDLPKCPCQLKKYKTVTTYHWYCWDIYETEEVFCGNPDPAKWKDPKVPTGAEEALHPGTKYSMRSISVDGNSNQCTYDSNCKLITTAPGSGTVDDKPPGTMDHFHHDVDPILLANFLDGGSQTGFLSMGKGDTKMVNPPGENVKKYYDVRPFWAEDCE